MKKEELQKQMDKLLAERSKIFKDKNAKPSDITDKLNKISRRIEAVRQKLEKK